MASVMADAPRGQGIGLRGRCWCSRYSGRCCRQGGGGCRSRSDFGSALVTGGRHHHARRAEAALQGVMLMESRLNRAERAAAGRRPSIVVIDAPSAITARTVQDLIACPSISTVQAPHCEVSQPTCVPVRPRSSLSRWTSKFSRLHGGGLARAVDVDGHHVTLVGLEHAFLLILRQRGAVLLREPDVGNIDRDHNAFGDRRCHRLFDDRRAACVAILTPSKS